MSDKPNDGNPPEPRYLIADDLIEFVPQGLCRELVAATLAEMDAEADDPVMFPDLDPDDLGDDVPDEHKEFVKSVAGKRLSELPPPTDDEREDELQNETLQAATQLVSCWCDVIHEAVRSDKGPVRLNENLVPLDPVPDDPVFEGCETWYQIFLPAVALTEPRAERLYEAFVDRFKQEISKSPVDLILPPSFIIKRDAQGHFAMLFTD